MAKCNAEQLEFSAFGARRIEADFSGGDVSSDGGLLLVREVDRRIRLTETAARALGDERRGASIAHSVHTLLRQRIYGLVGGYEDLNDHGTLRQDLLMQTLVGKDQPAASVATLCRFEQAATREGALALHGVLVEQFIASHRRPPEELVLDFDATDVPLHGLQEGRFFHGYYDHYCYLPLYVFCGEQLLVAYLRESRIDAAKHAGAVLKALVGRLRAAWPEVRIVLRADSGFCRRRLLAWCERNAVGYVVGLAKNARLDAASAARRAALARRFARTGAKQRGFMSVRYAAGTWKRTRRVIARLEHGPQGDNPRYLVTNLAGRAEALYDELYCARGEAENRIKEAQLGLFGDRLSAHAFAVNQFRLLLAALAYTLVERLRALALAGTEFANMQAQTLRTKLFKIGAVIVRSTRRVRVFFTSGYPYPHLLREALANLNSS